MRAIAAMIGLSALPFLASGQVIMLDFTALANGSHVDLDSVWVRNLSHPGDTVLYWPDTVLVVGSVGMTENPGKVI